MSRSGSGRPPPIVNRSAMPKGVEHKVQKWNGTTLLASDPISDAEGIEHIFDRTKRAMANAGDPISDAERR